MTVAWSRALTVFAALACATVAGAQGDLPGDPATTSFAFAVVGSAVAGGTGGEADRGTVPLLRAIDGSDARFAVHFDLSAASAASCSDASLARRRALLDASAKPVVPVAAAAEWAHCGQAAGDPLERLEHLGDVLFAGDESPGQARLSWVRQSSVPRFRRYRENLRWQVGPVLFATINLPDNNNNFRLGAGRNGEFEERLVANRAWLDRTFRLASERRLAGIVVFVDAAPRFSAPLRAPDLRAHERDGFYEWKVALRDFVPAFKGQVLLVQARYAAGLSRPPGVDQPLEDAQGRTIANFSRIALAEGADLRWMRIDVDPQSRKVFRVSAERIFDDPSGELYGR